MTKNCPQCSMSLSFETARLPTEPFTVVCPRCRQAVTIMPPEKAEPRLPDAPVTGGLAAPTPPQPSSADSAAGQPDLLRSLVALLSNAINGTQQKSDPDKWQRRRIMLCIEDQALRDKVRTTLDPAHYEVIGAVLATEATEMLAEFRAEAIVLSPGFDADHSGGAVMMQYVGRLTPQSRRRTFVVLLSPQLRTMDTYLAFANGVNLTIHPEDVDSLQAILERSIRDFNELYRPLYQAMEIDAF
jgi:PleD family two-component response regulator